MENEIKIYVFGSCHFSERLETDETVGNGGYGVVITVNGKKIDEISGGLSYTNNARIDIIGITEGLKRVKEDGNITVYLTNGYVIDTLTKGWLEKWKKTGFVKKRHVELWIELDKVMQELGKKIAFKHSRKVKYAADFVQAEKLAKNMSAKRNLPRDLHRDMATTSLVETSTAEIPSINAVPQLEDDRPLLDGSICVDASCTGNPGPTEYRGVDAKTGALIFEMKYEEATNNIGEFMAIVHALALSKRDGKELKVIYSDSLNAISWVRQKKCKTKFMKTEKNAKVFDHIERAVKWLQNNSYETKILKWNTGAWGEIPADYGRKQNT
jgi:ribonuclease HI